MTTALGLAFLGTSIRVTSDERVVLDWLSEFLRPAFQPHDGAVADFLVAVRHDRARYRMVADSRPTAVLTLVPCFARDQKLTRREAWSWNDQTVIGEGRLGALYVLAGNRVEVLAAPASTRFRTAVMRVVREIAVAPALRAAYRLSLHAAAVARGGRSVLFAGPRESGKSTTLAHVARSAGAAILANDRVVLSALPDGWDVHGVPTIVSLRRGTLDLMPELLRAIPPVPMAVDLTVAEGEALGRASSAALPAERVKLSPAQLAHALGSTLAAHAPLAAIAFPDARAGATEVAIERLDPPAALERLGASRFGLHADGNEPTVFAKLSGGARPLGADAPLLARLADEVPCFAVRIGRAAFRDAEGGARVLDALLR